MDADDDFVAMFNGAAGAPWMGDEQPDHRDAAGTPMTVAPPRAPGSPPPALGDGAPSQVRSPSSPTSPSREAPARRRRVDAYFPLV